MNKGVESRACMLLFTFMLQLVYILCWSYSKLHARIQKAENCFTALGITHPSFGLLYPNPQTPGKTLIGLYIETRKARPKYRFMTDKKITKQPYTDCDGKHYTFEQL